MDERAQRVPVVALVVADPVEKNRINPGNFVDGRKTFENTVYETDDDYFRDECITNASKGWNVGGGG